MFNLVVKVAVKKVVNVATSPEVHRRNNLAKVKGAGIRSTTIAKSVHVVPGMICDNGKKSMCVGKKLGKK